MPLGQPHTPCPMFGQTLYQGPLPTNRTLMAIKLHSALLLLTPSAQIDLSSSPTAETDMATTPTSRPPWPYHAGMQTTMGVPLCEAFIPRPTLVEQQDNVWGRGRQSQACEKKREDLHGGDGVLGCGEWWPLTWCMGLGSLSLSLSHQLPLIPSGLTFTFYLAPPHLHLVPIFYDFGWSA